MIVCQVDLSRRHLAGVAVLTNGLHGRDWVVRLTATTTRRFLTGHRDTPTSAACVRTVTLATSSAREAAAWEASFHAASNDANAVARRGKRGIGGADAPAKPRYRSIFKAATVGDLRTVQRLVDLHGTDVNEANPYGNSPLWLASAAAATSGRVHGLGSVQFGNDVSVVEFLLSKGADPYRRNELGQSSIDVVVARTTGNPDLQKAHNAAGLRIARVARDVLVRLLRLSELEYQDGTIYCHAPQTFGASHGSPQGGSDDDDDSGLDYDDGGSSGGDDDDEAKDDDDDDDDDDDMAPADTSALATAASSLLSGPSGIASSQRP